MRRKLIDDFNYHEIERRIVSDIDLPTLSTDPLTWIEQARPLVEGRPRTFLVAPFIHFFFIG